MKFSKILGKITGRKSSAAKGYAGGGGRYKIVQSPDQMLRERGFAEYGKEDEILNASRRGQLLDMARNQMRNSSTLNALLKQFDLNAVGTVGGKATFTLGTREASLAARAAFADWARECEYFDGLSLRDLLKIVLKTFLLGGDFVLLFDDNLVEDSGRVMMYEPDEIGNISDAEFARRFPAGWTQRQGKIYNAFGRCVGVIVSRSQRGQLEFNADSCYYLTKGAGRAIENDWLMPANAWRKDQGRGVSPLASVLATIIDLEDLANFELQAAKKNSQTLAQVTQTASTDAAAPSVFSEGQDLTSMTDGELAEAVDAETEGERTVSLDQIKAAGALYEVMPEGTRLELLDTKHPNQSMPEFIRWLAGRSAAPFGLGSVYATLKADASYTAFRGEQVMSWPAFEEAQKFLEGVCDWVIYHWQRWAVRHGEIDSAIFTDGWERRVSWAWPRMREVNQVDEQNALALRLKNGTGCYGDIYGADIEERLDQIAQEVELFRARGLAHPMMQTASGQVIDPAATENADKEGENQNG